MYTTYILLLTIIHSLAYSIQIANDLQMANENLDVMPINRSAVVDDLKYIQHKISWALYYGANSRDVEKSRVYQQKVFGRVRGKIFL